MKIRIGCLPKWCMAGILTGLFILFGMFVSAEDAGSAKTKASINFEKDGTLAAEGGMIRLKRVYAQKKSEPICFEAEEATALELQSTDKKIEVDDSASGGHYIHFVKMLAFHFTVETPGKYQVWYHNWFPLKANYNHYEYMDDSPIVQNVQDSMMGELDEKKWHWVKGPLYELEKGGHDYVFPSPTAFCAGARLDKIILVPEGQELSDDAKMKLAGSLTAAGSTGEMISSSIKLKKIAQWELNYQKVENSGAIKVEYSYDDGKTWTAFSGQPETPVEVPDSARDGRLCFKISIAGKEGCISPRVEGFTLYVYRGK